LYNFLNKNKLASLKFNQNSKKKVLEIKTVFQNKIKIIFKYNLNSIQKKHHINNINFFTKNDILSKMLNRIFTNKVDYDINKKKALFIIKFINIIKKKMQNLKIL
jgi:elongation factor P--beta-lysine ligase